MRCCHLSTPGPGPVSAPSPQPIFFSPALLSHLSHQSMASMASLLSFKSRIFKTTIHSPAAVVAEAPSSTIQSHQNYPSDFLSKASGQSQDLRHLPEVPRHRALTYTNLNCLAHRRLLSC
ncbi:transcription factor TCP4-like [Pyrus ussuriensis x Pyrus communis]|uniref:Transcription factor TCP4-like n=1 Tax=Pyrus ussuriensis x Pyrus communis TaxID=2448454 RepID=A0A5N5F1Z4_9ROSA|nr:transcription factor TCP4-like [Pyrus ussuriensis x Pyrus communis]